jgi:hypothetical protein
MSACIYVVNSDYVDVKNNIISGCKYAYDFEEGTQNSTIDYNNVYTSDASYVGKWNKIFKSWSDWRSSGNDVNSLKQDPKYISAFNLGIQPISPSRGTGINQSQYFNADILGIPRSASWDMGAYGYSSQTMTPPSNFRVGQPQ